VGTSVRIRRRAFNCRSCTGGGLPLMPAALGHGNKPEHPAPETHGKVRKTLARVPVRLINQ
jgi:hypothetical protein